MQAIQDDGFFHTTASTIGQQTENTEKQTASNYYEDQQPSSSTSYGGQNPENIQELGTSQTSQPFIDPASGRPTLRVAARMSANYYEDQQPSCSTSYGGQNPENLKTPGSTQTSLPFIDPSTGRPMFRVQRRSLPNYFEDQQPSSSTSYGGQNPEITKKPGSTQTFLPFIDPSTGRPMLRVQRRLLTDVFEDQQPSCSTSYGGQNPLNVDVPSYTSTWQQTMDAKMAMVQIPPNLVPSYYEDQQPSCSTSYGGQNPKNMEEAGTSYTFDPQPSCSSSYGGQSVEEPGTSYTSDQQSSRSTFYAGQNPENIKKPGTSQTSTGQQTMEPNMAIVQMPETLFPDFYQDQQPSCSNMGDEQTKKEEEGTSRTMDDEQSENANSNQVGEEANASQADDLNFEIDEDDTLLHTVDNNHYFNIMLSMISHETEESLEVLQSYCEMCYEEFDHPSYSNKRCHRLQEGAEQAVIKAMRLLGSLENLHEISKSTIKMSDFLEKVDIKIRYVDPALMIKYRKTLAEFMKRIEDFAKALQSIIRRFKRQAIENQKENIPIRWQRN